MSLFPGPYKIYGYKIMASNGNWIDSSLAVDGKYTQGDPAELCALLNAGWTRQEPPRESGMLP